MARVRVKLEDIAVSLDVDHAKIEATSDDDIRRHMAEDGFDPDQPFHGLREVTPVETIRAKAGLSQAEMARRLRVPLQTWQDWEKGRTVIEPAVAAFRSGTI